ncbi:serine protease inhibitor 42Dd-like, partial [Calliphora vicina]|uniref:serine protease inhibitor 42Dd-like n=1 Tax=Calliphora vicina TaxID=7373 RepID=UPI00325B921C
FNAKLFGIMTERAQHQNLVYSPISLQILLSFIYTISDGKLYDELRHILAEPSNDRLHVANAIQKLINSPLFNTAPTTLIMANKLYYDHRFGPVNDNVRSLVVNNFASELEQIDFQDPHKAAYIINSWVSDNTNHLIRDIIAPSTITPNTNAVILNSLYFKSDWLNKFSIYDTKLAQFHLSRETQVAVEMMSTEDIFQYGDFGDLRAYVLELPYKTSNLTMMLILPHEIDGLLGVEHKLSHYSWEMLSQQLRSEVVSVKIPKFKIEFDVDMMRPLQRLGLNALFNKDGKINIFKDQQFPISVDQVKHKTYISVNEDGTEAAASTFGKLIPYSLNHNMKHFVADQPFLFVIRSTNAIFFIGHVVKF